MSGISKNFNSVEVPEIEQRRLVAVHKYKTLIAGTERDLHNIVELAAQFCNTQSAFISLVEADRQLFKATRNWSYKETPRNSSICTHTILQNEIMEVCDTLEDDRFKNNPFVTDNPQLRFYAGMPLISSEGECLGTLAVVDYKPRKLNDQQFFALRALAQQVINVLDLKFKNLELNEAIDKNAYCSNLLEHTNDAIFSTDFEERVITWNKGAERIFGISKEEAIGQDSTSIIDSPISEDEKEMIRQALKEHHIFRLEKPLQSRDGNCYFVEYTINTVRSEDDEIKGYVIVVKDITDQHCLEDELRKNNEELKSRVEEKIIEITNVFERVSDGFVAIDLQGICTYANKKAEQMVNCPSGYLIGKYIWHEFHASVEQAFKPHIQKAITTQEPQAMEVYYPLYERWFDNYIYPSSTGVSIYFRDITKRKNAEIKIKQSDETLRLIMNSSLDAIIGMDYNGLLTEWNVRAEKIFGWTREEVLGKELSEIIIPQQDRHNHREGVRRYLETGKWTIIGSLIETTALHRSGREFPVELTVVPIKQNEFQFFCAFIRDITDRKAAQQKIKESEERYREIVENAHEGIWLIDENSNTTFVNDYMANMLGYDKSEMYGKHLYYFMNEENRIVAEYNLARRKKGIREQHDFTFQTKDKTEIITSVKTNPIFYNGQYQGALAMVMDVTQRRRMEEKLILSERRFRALIENSTDGLTVLGADGVVLDMSPSAQKILGYDPMEIIGSNRPELIHPDDQKKVVDIFMRVQSKPGATEQFEYRHVMPDGTHKWLECIFNNLLDEPAVNAVVLNYRDITERKSASDELVKINERFKLITHATNDVVWDWDLVKDEIWWNENYFSLFEYDKNDSQPGLNSWYDGIHPDDKERVVSGVHGAIKDGKYFWVDEYRFGKADGTYLDIYDRAYMIYDADGKPLRMIGAKMDISKRKMAEDQLKAQFEELQKKNYELDQFVYSVSHDLRAPLASVLGLINIAEMENLPPSQKDYFSLMRCSINKLDDFIREILDYSRNSRMELRIEKIDFDKMLFEIQERLKSLKDVNRLNLKVDVYGDVAFFSDKIRLTIIFNNLLENAVLYQDYRKPLSFVNIRINVTTDQAKIEVHDNGIGIESKFIEKIFNMFFRASSQSTGSGLGLYIVKEATKRLGGTIAVASEQGMFTSFNIVIPNRLAR